jgi:hypothetical protein
VGARLRALGALRDDKIPPLITSGARARSSASTLPARSGGAVRHPELRADLEHVELTFYRAEATISPM